MHNVGIIEMPRDLTSFEFYSNVVKQMKYINVQGKREVILDFSETMRIEPLVVPNLLCMGHIIKEEKNGQKARIYIPDTTYSGGIKNYLLEIDFVSLAHQYELYEFMTSPYSGVEGKKIDPICGTLYFGVENSYDQINHAIKNCIMPFADGYLGKFRAIRRTDEGLYEVNEITEFLEEIIFNCKQHAKSCSFTTLHAKYSVGKIYISVSDMGCGFRNTVGSLAKPLDESEAILLGVYERKKSKVYGLYNVIRRVLEFDGKVRIHSNDSQVIFTPKVLEKLRQEELYNDEIFKKFNIKKDIPFEGVHIEIELPLEWRK